MITALITATAAVLVTIIFILSARVNVLRAEQQDREDEIRRLRRLLRQFRHRRDDPPPRWGDGYTPRHPPTHLFTGRQHGPEHLTHHSRN